MSDSPANGSDTTDITAQFRAATVRIFNLRDVVVGAGVLIADRHLVTCAHVVAQALGTKGTDADPPAGQIQLDFPLLAPNQRMGARVVAWRPDRVGTDGAVSDESDLAILELEGDPLEGSMPPRLTFVDDLWGHRFRAFGFPAQYNGGTYATGVLRAGGTDGRILIEDTKQTGFFIQPGFSGGLVWDEDADGMVGIAVTADTRAELRAAFIIPIAILVRVWPALAEPENLPRPYRGLFAFREEDAPFFFGRDAAIEQIEKAVRSQSLVAVIGASGSGKSSVIYAGLLPRLRPNGSWLAVSFRPGSRPFHNLAEALVPLLEPDLRATDQLTEIGKLASALDQGHVWLTDTFAMILGKHPQANRLLLIADQFEELYAPGQDRDVQERFLDQMLMATKRAPLQPSLSFGLVLTMRADFYGHALSYRPFADALQGPR
jgi:hypothetical protein